MSKQRVGGAWLILGWGVSFAAACATSPPAQPVPAPPARVPPAVTAARPDDPVTEIRQLESEVAQRPSDGEAWQHLSVALRRANRLQEAARAGWEAIELLPGWETWMTLGNVFLKAGNLRATLAAYEKSAETATDHDLVARNFLNAGYRAWGFADFARAEKAYRRASAASDDNALVHYDLANLYASTGRLDEARTEADRAVALIDALPISKLPTQAARKELEVMRALLNEVLAGHPVSLPPPTESGQVLPQRFVVQPPHGQALALKIDPMTMRMYPLDANQMFALTVPSEWVETVTCDKGRTDIRLAPGSSNRAMVLLVTATAASADFTPRAAAERAASALQSSHTARVEPLQPIVVKAGEAYLFWSTDLNAKPNNPGDYPFLAQLTGRYDGVVISATMLLSEDSPESRQILPLLGGMISTHRLSHPTPDPNASSGPIQHQ